MEETSNGTEHRLEGQRRPLRMRKKLQLWNCGQVSLMRNSRCKGPDASTKEVKKWVTEEEERSEEGHKMRLESSRGHGFLQAMLRKVDFTQSEVGSH